MRGRFADTLTDSWLDGAPPTAARDACRYAGVMVDDPFAVDPLLAEAGGLVYGRRLVDWTRVGRLLVNTADIKMHVDPGTRILGLLFFNAAVNGTFGGAAYLDAPVVPTARGFWTLPAGQVALAVDAT